jgi:hypothetical protein
LQALNSLPKSDQSSAIPMSKGKLKFLFKPKLKLPIAEN